jgi:hypothetical protein
LSMQLVNLFLNLSLPTVYQALKENKTLIFGHGSIEGNKKERFFGTELYQVKN